MAKVEDPDPDDNEKAWKEAKRANASKEAKKKPIDTKRNQKKGQFE